MIIGIDGNEANGERRVGIGEYAYELLAKFAKFDPPNGWTKFEIYLKEEPRSDLPREREGWRYRVVGPRKLWTQFALPLNLYIHKPRPDVFFTPTHYAPRFSPIPTVISIMDLSYIHYPDMFKRSDLYQLRNWTSYSVRHAKKIFTISESSKHDIIKTYVLPSERVVVTYPGVKMQKANVKSQKSVLEKYGIERDYILFVGTIQPRKNIARLIEAFSKLKPKTSNLSLIIVGKKGWLLEDILAAPKKFGVEKNVQFLDFVPDEDLAIFYQKALFFILPSLYEGFGLPVLEAMANGCPVITSNVSSLPEAGGDAALYVDPNNVDDIANKMKTLLEDEEVRNKLVEKGYQQAKKFSWEKTARETLAVLEEVAHEG